MAKSKQDRKKENEKVDQQAKGKKGKDGKDEKFKEEKVPVRLLEFYRTKIVPELIKKFSYKNNMQAPKLQKIILNCGAGAAVADPKIIDSTVKDLEAITGQHPTVIKAKKSVSNFKLRQGMNIGVRVTLRNDRMYEFLDRLINVDNIARIMGMDVTFVTSARTDEEAFELLKSFGLPFTK